MRRTVLLIIGWVLTVVGAIVTPLPPPFAFGIYLLGAGIAILIANSRAVRRFIQFLRLRHPRLCAFLLKAERVLPRVLGKALSRTGPATTERWRRLKARRPALK